MQDVFRIFFPKILTQRTSNFDNGPKNDTVNPICRHSKSCKIHTNGPRHLNLDLNDPLKVLLMIENVPRKYFAKASVQGTPNFGKAPKILSFKVVPIPH